jgi:hypothetical protein
MFSANTCTKRQKNLEQMIRRSGRCARKKDLQEILHVAGTEMLNEEKFLEEALANYHLFAKALQEYNGNASLRT